MLWEINALGGVLLLGRVVAALVALFVGWLLASWLSGLAGRFAGRLQQVRWLQGNVPVPGDVPVDRILARVAYYLLLLLVLALALEILGVRTVTEPFLAMINQFLLAVPNLVKALLIFLGAWLLATVLRALTHRFLASRAVGSLIARSGAAPTPAAQERLTHSLGELAFYLTLFLFMPAMFGALRLEGLVVPFQEAVAQLLGFVPNLFAALLIAAVGYVVARVVREITAHFLATVGVDALPAKVGLERVFERTPLAQATATVVFVLVLVPVLISALEALRIRAISEPAIGMLARILDMVPSLLAAVAVLAVGLAFARWAGTVVADFAERLNLPRFLVAWGLLAPDGSRSLRAVLEGATAGILALFVLIQSLEILRLPMLAGVLQRVLLYLPNVAVALAILAAGWVVGRFADQSVRRIAQGTPYPPQLGTVARYAILVLVAVMALEQLGVARAVVVNLVTVLLGSVGLGLAIALGLGARDLVKEWLERTMKDGR